MNNRQSIEYNWRKDRLLIVGSGIIIFLLAILTYLALPAFGQTLNSSSGTKIIDIEKIEGVNNTYRVLFDFCPNVVNKNTIGVLLTSSIDTVPVPIFNPDIRAECATYGAKVLAFSTTKIKAVNFDQTDLNSLIKAFEEKITSTENNLQNAQQKLDVANSLQDANKIQELENYIKNQEAILKSHKSGLRTLLSMTS